MRLALSTAFVAVAALLASHGLGLSAVGGTGDTQPMLELVVFEHPDCSYCPAFRRNVVQRYQASPHATEVTLRFVDVAATDLSRYKLKLPISIVPTSVLIKNGLEIDRIAGYWAPDNFFKMVAYIRSKAE